MSLISYIKSHSPKDFVDEAREVTWLALPALAAQFCRIAVYIVNGLFLGRLQDEAMAASAIATSWHNSSLYFGIGISFAMDTLVSQAFGARNYKLIGIVFQNALVVVSAMALPIALCFWFTEPILVLLRQDATLAKLAGSYNRWLIPGILPLLIYRAQCQYLQNQRILTPAMFSGAVSVVLSIPLNWFLIYGFPEMHIFGLQGAALHTQLKVFGGWKGFGFIGAPMAGALTWMMQPILLWSYVTWTGVHRQSWGGCDLRKAVDPKSLALFLKLGIPSACMMALEVVGFEIATIFVGVFKDVTAVKAHSIAFNLNTWIWIIPIGFSIGSATRVGNRLGEGNAVGAKFSALVGFLTIGGILVFLTTGMIAFKSYIPLIYSSSPAVVEACRKLMPLVALLALLDGAQTFAGALMRSVGKPLAGSIVSFLGYYLLSLPVAAGLAWGAKMKLFGVWWGLLAGLAGAVTGYLVLISRVDWEKEALLARERVDAAHASEAAHALDDDAQTDDVDGLVALELGAHSLHDPNNDDEENALYQYEATPLEDPSESHNDVEMVELQDVEERQ